MFYGKRIKELEARMSLLQKKVDNLNKKVGEYAANTDRFAAEVDKLYFLFEQAAADTALRGQVVKAEKETAEEPCALADESKANPTPKKRRQRRKNGKENPKASE